MLYTVLLLSSMVECCRDESLVLASGEWAQVPRYRAARITSGRHCGASTGTAKPGDAQSSS